MCAGWRREKEARFSCFALGMERDLWDHVRVFVLVLVHLLVRLLLGLGLGVCGSFGMRFRDRDEDHGFSIGRQQAEGRGGARLVFHYSRVAAARNC